MNLRANTTTSRKGATTLLLVGMLLLCAPAATAQAQAIRVYAAIAQGDVYVGEPFQYQIIIDGYEQAGKVDLTPLQAWSPRGGGGQNLSQTTISIVNGRRSEQKIKRYVMAYQLTTAQAGRTVIPAVSVEVQGRQYRTNPVEITALAPGTTERLDLQVSFSDTTCYVGQPIIMTVNWFIDVDLVNRLGNFTFDIPVLRDRDGFFVEEAQGQATPGKELQIELEGQAVVARQLRTRHQGKDSVQVFFSRILIPKKPGTINTGPPKVTCQIDISQGSQARRDRFGFDSFFDSFDQRREYQRFQALAQTATLTVKPLPTDGRPADFYGLVGRYSILSSATPTQVHAGDPITLQITITGELLKPVRMPDLQALPSFANNFRIPAEQAGPRIVSHSKVFTQTIRANNDDATEIAAIPLSYFDVDKGKYVTTHSEAIPLTVEPTQVVTANEAIGHEMPLASREIQAVQRGIAANYEGPELLRNAMFSPTAALTQPAYMALWAGPSVVLLASVLLRLARQSSPARRQARQHATAASKAVTRLRRLARHASSDADAAKQQTADILRGYIGDRYDRNAASLTARDCRVILNEAVQDAELINNFCEVLERCEHSRFAGGYADGQQIDLREISNLIRKLDKQARI